MGRNRLQSKVVITCNVILILFLANVCEAQYITKVRQESQHPLRHKDLKIRTTTTNFDNILSSADTTLNAALETLDDAITSDTPLIVTVACTPNQTAFDARYFYVCIAINKWRRVELASWGQGSENVLYAAEQVIYNGENVTYP